MYTCFPHSVIYLIRDFPRMFPKLGVMFRF